MTAYLQTHFDEDSAGELSQQWKKGTTANFKSSRGKFSQQNPENNNTNYKQKKNKMNLNNSRNDARQNLKITF